jgi:hypothetical protein
VTARSTNPNGATGAIGATTTICPQQHRQPSAEQPSSESCEACVENRQSGDAFAAQARISVAARSSKRTATKLRASREATIVCPLIMSRQPRGCAGRHWILKYVEFTDCFRSLSHVRKVVEDAGGHERVRLGAPLADPLIHGVRRKRDGAVSGLLINDANGNERGSYVTSEVSGAAFVTLDSEDDQPVLLAHPKGGANFYLRDKGNLAQITVFAGEKCQDLQLPDDPKLTMSKGKQTVLELHQTDQWRLVLSACAVRHTAFARPALPAIGREVADFAWRRRENCLDRYDTVTHHLASHHDSATSEPVSSAY